MIVNKTSDYSTETYFCASHYLIIYYMKSIDLSAGFFVFLRGGYSVNYGLAIWLSSISIQIGHQ